MKTKLSLLLLVLGSFLAAAPAEIGQSEADLLQQQPKPLGRIVAGSKVVYRWPEMQVTVKEGKVSEIKLIDAEKEKIALEKRAEVLAAKQQEAEQKKAYQAAKTGKPTAGPDAARLANNSAINARIAVLRQEQNEATENLRKAESVGGKAKAAYYRAEIEKRNTEIARLLTLAK
jgi:hypothetical protein